MRISMIGLRGVPNTYSGVEKAVEEIGARLAKRGHDVTVYCMANRSKERPRSYRGMRLIYIPTIQSKNLEMIIYCTLATVHVLFRRRQVVHFHAVGPASMSVLTMLRRAASVMTVHGLDWTREKWSAPARLYLRCAAWLATKCVDEVICVSRAMQKFFIENYDRTSTYIPNGVAPALHLPLGKFGGLFGLKSKRYVLFVGRLVPEKRVDQLIIAFKSTHTDLMLVIAGGGEDSTANELRDLCAGDTRIVMTGPVDRSDLARLYSNAALFVLPSAVEGLSLALLEALSYQLPVLVSDIPANLEVIRDGHEELADTFRAGDASNLAHRLTQVIPVLASRRTRAVDNAQRLLHRYDWDGVAMETLEVYRRIQH